MPAYGRSGGGIPVSPEYDVDATMRAMEANAWVWACVQAISTDLAGLPLVAETGVGVDRVQSADHWLLALLENPHPKVSGRKFRKQLVADLAFGNAFARVWRDANGRPYQLGRIPPGVIEPIVAADGEEVGFKLGTGELLAWDQVLHIADVSVGSQRSLVWGSTPIAPLALRLQVDRDASRMAGRAARRGRIEMLLSPRDALTALSADAVQGLVDQYVTAAESGHGIYVAGVGMEAAPLSLSARDMEWSSLADRTRAEVLAVFGVPETRVGSPAANYGTSREQSRIYWGTLRGRAALIDDELSRLAEPGVRIRHSFAGVDALQVSQTERQARGVTWMREYGLSEQQAAAYEGFVDLPVGTGRVHAPESQPATAPSSTGVDEPRADTVRSLLASYASAADSGTDVSREQLESALLVALAGLPHADDAASVAAYTCWSIVRSARERGGAVAGTDAFGARHVARILQEAT